MYQASVLGFWLAVVLLWTAFVGTDLNKQQVQIRNRLLKQQLLSRMDDDEKELLSVVVDTNLAHMSAKSAGSAKTQRRRKASTRGQGIRCWSSFHLPAMLLSNAHTRKCVLSRKAWFYRNKFTHPLRKSVTKVHNFVAFVLTCCRGIPCFCLRVSMCHHSWK